MQFVVISVLCYHIREMGGGGSGGQEPILLKPHIPEGHRYRGTKH